MTLSLVNWNVGWATPRSRKWKRDGILDRISSHNPDVICLTETDIGLLSKDRGIIYPQIDRVSERQGREKPAESLAVVEETMESD